MAATLALSAPRAVGVARISQRGGRDDDELHSLDNQATRMALLCQAQAWDLGDVYREDGVSGGARLAARPGLLAAVQAIEAGAAEVLVVAFKDRLDREPTVRDEVIDRVEAVGGMVWTADHGRDTNTDAVAQFSGTVLSAAGRMTRRQAGERSREAVAEAVAEGKVPWRHITPGYRRGADGRLEVVEHEAEAVREAFAMRAAGAAIPAVRAHLAARGIERSFRGVQTLLASPVVLGRIEFGDIVNEAAHPAIVSRDVWEAVQRIRVPRGRQAKSERLLARLGVLRCAACGARMVVHSRANGDRYRCPPVGDCTAKCAINADLVEGIVERAVRAAAGDATGAASALDRAREDRARREDLDARVSRAVRAFVAAGLEDDPTAVEELASLRAARDEAAESEEASLRAAGAAAVVLDADWDDLSLAERRDLIRAVVDEVTVARGRGADRVSVRLVG